MRFISVRALCLFIVLLWCGYLFAAVFVIRKAHSRDLGQWAQVSPEQRQFYNGLKDRTGRPCCDDHDGFDVEDSEITPSGYRVRVNGEWFDVPPNAQLNIRNRYGSARAWIGLDENGKRRVACFIAGMEG